MCNLALVAFPFCPLYREVSSSNVSQKAIKMTTDNLDGSDQIQRKDTTFISNRSRFHGKSDSNSQYYGLYQAREHQLRDRVLDACEDRVMLGGKWANAVAAGSIVHLEPNQVSYVVGTIYMDMPLKPNVLDEITRESWVAAPPPRSNYCSDNDVVILEDSNGRVPLSGEVLKDFSLTTGMVTLFDRFVLY